MGRPWAVSEALVKPQGSVTGLLRSCSVGQGPLRVPGAPSSVACRLHLGWLLQPAKVFLQGPGRGRRPRSPGVQVRMGPAVALAAESPSPPWRPWLCLLQSQGWVGTETRPPPA